MDAGGRSLQTPLERPCQDRLHSERVDAEALAKTRVLEDEEAARRLLHRIVRVIAADVVVHVGNVRRRHVLTRRVHELRAGRFVLFARVEVPNDVKHADRLAAGVRFLEGLKSERCNSWAAKMRVNRGQGTILRQLGRKKYTKFG